MVDVRFEHVSKRYRIRQSTAAPGLLGRLRGTRQEFWAVQDANFEVEHGESLGIIGHNGAGKSTILKLLSSITAPTEGRITINGRLSALLEVGSGFHPELTGRENIYLSGSILGMRRSEITSKIDDIIDFAEVRQFIDVPVKRYSSGMFVRLGFAIAAHLNPDILLLDEVLAVGDASFQERCIERVLEMKNAGTTIVFISHDLAAVERLCSRVLLMKKGQLIAHGSAADMIEQYRSSGGFVQSRTAGHVLGRVRGAEITDVQFFDSNGNRTNRFATGGPLAVQIAYKVYERIEKAHIGLYFFPPGRGLDAQFTTRVTDEYIDLERGEGVIEFTCEQIGLQAGVYDIDVAIEEAANHIDWLSHCTAITVEEGPVRLAGHFAMPHDWRVVRQCSETVEDGHGASV